MHLYCHPFSFLFDNILIMREYKDIVYKKKKKKKKNDNIALASLEIKDHDIQNKTKKKERVIYD